MTMRTSLSSEMPMEEEEDDDDAEGGGGWVGPEMSELASFSGLGGANAHGGIVKKRWIEVHLYEARNLPVMDDDTATCDAYLKVKISGKTLESKVKMKTLDPVWDEVLSTKLELSSTDDLVLELMDWDMDAHDLIGTIEFPIGDKDEAMLDVQDRCVKPIISAGRSKTSTYVDGWFPVVGERGRNVKGVTGKTEVRLKVVHVLVEHDNTFKPSAELMRLVQTLPHERGYGDVKRAAAEMMMCCGAASQLPGTMLAGLIAVGEAKEWKKDDVVYEQLGSGSEDSLHFMLEGVVSLHAHEKRGNRKMYKVLKGRSFAMTSSFGPCIGRRGPGEAFAEGALQLRPGSSCTAVCVSDKAVTMRVDRRECELLIDHFRRRELGVSFKQLVPVLSTIPENRGSQYNKSLCAYLSHHVPAFKGLTEITIARIANASTFRMLEAGEFLRRSECRDVMFVVIKGTASIHAAHRS